MTRIGLIFLTCLFSCGAQLLLRSGASHVKMATLTDLRWLINWRVACGLALFSVSTLVWIYVLSKTPLSYAYLVAGINYLLIPIASRYVLGEALTSPKVAAMVFISIGILILGVGERTKNAGEMPGPQSLVSPRKSH